MENFKPSGLEWLLMGCSNYSELTGGILVFWKSGHLQEVVA